MQNTKKNRRKHKVSLFAEIGECQTTGNKSLYPSTEWSMDRGFDCICQSENCLGYIQGASHLPLNVLTKYKLSDYIQSKLKVE